MTWLPGFSSKDKVILLSCAGLVCAIAILVGVLGSSEEDDSPIPSSYLTGKQGAKAAYLLLEKSGYRIERWTKPFAELPAKVDEHTTVILAAPFPQDNKAAQGSLLAILARGGRVVSTGYTGGVLLPENEVQRSEGEADSVCRISPNGFGEIANSGKIDLPTHAIWKRTRPDQHTEYVCGEKPVVLSYSAGRGKVIWWASSYPLENIGIQKEENLSLLLNSVGPSATTRVIWDESLHGEAQPSLWDYTKGTPLHLVWLQLFLVGGLLLWSFTRRSGPLRSDPRPSRAAPIEFVLSLGALLRQARATNATVKIAYDRFRYVLEKRAGITKALGAKEVAGNIARRYPDIPSHLEQDLILAEEAAYRKDLSEEHALAIVQTLKDCETRLSLANKKPAAKTPHDTTF